MSPESARAPWRARLPIVVVVLACVAGVTAAVTGAANPLAAVNFLMPGHWVFNGASKMAIHVDGATGDVDARARIPDGQAGSQIYQGDTSGYVVGNGRITEFGKSSLEVEGTSAAPSGEDPVGLEIVGGPYLVYRDAGRIFRLGKDPVNIDVGGPVGNPVATRDGTVWLPRTSAGFLCELSPGAATTSCRVPLPEGSQGAMTVVNDRPMFVDTTADMLHTVEPDGLGAGRELGTNVSDTVRVASTDVAGRVAMLDGNILHLVDSGVDPASAPVEPEKVDLPDGDYDGPVSTGSAVALVDRSTDTLMTYDSRGEPKDSKSIPPERGDPRLTLGEDDRIYVDGDEGDHVMVVDEDGSVTDVPLVGEDEEAPSPDREPELGSDSPAGPPANGPPPVVAGPPLPDREPQSPPQTDVQDEPEDNQQQPPPPPVVPASPPGAPTAVSATAADGSATVTWGPAPDNRAPITGYTVSWAGGSLPVGPVGTATISGLANGTSYVFTVTATNAAGTGPGASSNPVTPVAPVPSASPAAPPVNLNVAYDATDRPTRDMTVTWGQPALNGGTLLHYVVSATGQADRTVTATTTMYEQLGSDSDLTFTVHAVTQAPDGQTLQGEPASQTVPASPAPQPTIRLSQGELTDEYCGDSPDCAWMHIEVTGWPPDTEITLEAHSSREGYSNRHPTVTSPEGTVSTNRFAYAGVDDEVYITAALPDGTVIESNRITWEAAG